MGYRLYMVICALIFNLVALVHAMRLVFEWPFQIGHWMVPLWVSWGGLVVFGALSIWGFTLAMKR